MQNAPYPFTPKLGMLWTWRLHGKQLYQHKGPSFSQNAPSAMHDAFRQTTIFCILVLFQDH